jgi:hypothetical protein
MRHSISVTAPESLQTQEAQDQTECRTPPQSPTLYGIGKVTALTPKLSRKRLLPVSESRYVMMLIRCLEGATFAGAPLANHLYFPFFFCVQPLRSSLEEEPLVSLVPWRMFVQSLKISCV